MPPLIDATGKACPIPFMLAKKEMDGGTRNFSVLVDNKPAVENLAKLARSQLFEVSVSAGDAPYTVTFTSKGEETVAPPPMEARGHGSSLIYLASDTMGNGDHELGRNLIRMFLYTIDQGNWLPETIICLNKGVFLATEDAQTANTLGSLESKGVSIIACGTCLDYYHLTEKLQVGSIGNMYDIAKKLTSAQTIIRP